MLLCVFVSVNPSRPGDLKECFNANLELTDNTSVRKCFFHFIFTL